MEQPHGDTTKAFEKAAVHSYKDLVVYNRSFQLAMEIYRLSKTFPLEERYGLSDQMIRAARSIPGNIAEGWAKRHYENVFKRHLIDCIGSCEEMRVWLDFVAACDYLPKEDVQQLAKGYSDVSKMLTSLASRWQTFRRC